MSRRSLSAIVLSVLAALTLTGCSPDGVKSAGYASVSSPDLLAMGPGQPAPIMDPTDLRPNIVMISADDMRADEIRYLPQTQALIGSRGMTFTEALTPHPLCCPARAELLTGQYAQNNGVRSNWGPQGGYEPLDYSRTIATMMNDAGYNTAFLGKHLNSVKFPTGPNPGWTLFNPSLSGYGDYYSFNQYNDGNETLVENEYYTDYLKDEAQKDLTLLSSFNSPFFMWVSNFGPHSGGPKDGIVEPGVSPPAVSPSYRANPALVQQGNVKANQYFNRIKNKPSYREADRSDKAQWIRKKAPYSNYLIKDMLRGRIGALHALDAQIANTVRHLDRLGELENTYLVFITDNGYLVGEHGLTNKIVGYEEALRTPLLFSGPGIPVGSVSDRVVTLVDLAPTFLNIAGASSSLTMDGVSMASILRNPVAPSAHDGGVLIQAGPTKGATGPRGWFYRGVRTDRYTFIRYNNGFRELYDRNKDPHQMRSVAYKPAYSKVRAELERRTRTLSTCSGPASCNRQYGPLPKPRLR